MEEQVREPVKTSGQPAPAGDSSAGKDESAGRKRGLSRRRFLALAAAAATAVACGIPPTPTPEPNKQQEPAPTQPPSPTEAPAEGSDQAAQKPVGETIGEFYEKEVNPVNFQAVLLEIETLAKEIPVKLVLQPGEYWLPAWQEDNALIPTVFQGGLGESQARVNYQIANKRKLELISASDQESPVIRIDGEVGIFLKDCQSVTFGNLIFEGGNPRTLSERGGELSFDPLRSLVLAADCGYLAVHNCKFQGRSLGEYLPDSEASIRGLTVFNSKKDAQRGVLEINDCQFINNPWDSILVQGATDAQVKNVVFKRGVESYFYNNQETRLFIDTIGTGIAALDGASLSLKGAVFQGYNKCIMVNGFAGGVIDDIRIEAPSEISGEELLNRRFSWIISGQYPHDWDYYTLMDPSFRRASLEIRNLTMYQGDPTRFNADELARIPFYESWFIYLDFLGQVSASNLSLALHLSEQNRGIPLPERSLVGVDYPWFPDFRFSLSNWECIVMQDRSRLEEPFDPVYPSGDDINISPPKIIVHDLGF